MANQDLIPSDEVEEMLHKSYDLGITHSINIIEDYKDLHEDLKPHLLNIVSKLESLKQPLTTN